MSNPRRRALVMVLATILGALLMAGTPTQAADQNPDLSVRIRSLSPSVLKVGSTVTMAGTVTNHDNHAWEKVQAYLVIPASPFTTRAQIDEAIGNGNAYTGTRVVEVGAFDDMGDLAPGQTRRFRIKVPYAQLGLSAAEGVYPIGVQLLGTDSDGERSGDAIARATTFLPLLSSAQDPVPTSIIWPFLMPDSRKADGNYADPEALLSAVGAGGRLRNLLDLASGTTGSAATVLLDPALLVGVDDLAHGRHVPDRAKPTIQQKADAGVFLADLIGFAQTRSLWVLDFDRPDDLALSQNPDLRRGIESAIDEATESTLATYQLSGRRVSWPTRKGVTATLLRDLRGAGDRPAIVSPAALPGWERRLGSLVRYSTSVGPMPLLVNDVLDADVPGRSSVVTLRQRILSEAALAVLERAIDDSSRADAVTLVDPRWNPGSRWQRGRLSQAFTAPFTRATSLDSLLTRSLSTYAGEVPANSKAKTLTRAQLEAADQIVANGKALTSVIPRNDAVDAALARDVAGVLGVRWRQNPLAGTTIARTRAREASAALKKISIEAPPSVTLSSAEGRFPLTIRNDSDQSIRVGVALDSSNPALRIPAVKPVDIGAGERHTTTIEINLGQQKATYVTAHVRAANGREIGDPAEFKVRSSKVGAVLWVAMGLAGLLVLAALVRRFRRQRTLVTSERMADDD